MKLRGPVSWFGGPDDNGVASDEGLAFIYEVEDAPHLFLPSQPPGTTGLARRLDPEKFYIACRWDYNIYPKESLLKHTALVYAPSTGMEFVAFPADWGPHEDTDRVADISPGLMDALGITTDEEVEVTYPYDEKGISPMPYQRIVISSGHGLHVRGAHGIIDEVDEARIVTEALAEALRCRGVEVVTFHDDVSQSQSENLNRITDFHNDQNRDLDISVHFNAYEQIEGPRGTEVLYVTQSDLAGNLAAAISEGGDLINRGGKYRSDLHFLNCTNEPSVLLEVCFVDSEADVNAYKANLEGIIEALAFELSGIEEIEEGEEGEERPPRPPRPPRPRPIPRVDIEVSGEVLIFVNGEQVGTKGR